MKKIYSDEQIVAFVREAEKTGATIAGFCRQKGFNEGTFYKWKKRFGKESTGNVRRKSNKEKPLSKTARLFSFKLW
jgi:transposase-like protein